MMVIFRLVIAALGWVLVPSAPALAVETAQQAYMSKCSVCHDTGAANAPRLTEPARWAQLASQGRGALYQVAVSGKPNTAMAAKGGFASLTDAETRAIVDYILAVTGNAGAPLTGPALPGTAAPAGSARAPGASDTLPISDAALSEAIATRLLAVLGKPGMRLDPYEGVITIRGLGIRVEVRQGATILGGVIEDASLIGQAEALVKSTPGVTTVTNRMVTAGMLDFD